MKRVCIFIPTFNRAEYLLKAIESSLNQTYENYYILVSDNNSEDNTNEVVSKFSSNEKIQYFKHDRNIGMVNNWRYALDNLIESDYVLILSDDDELIDDDYISKTINMTSDIDYDLIFSNGEIEYLDNNKKEIMQHSYTPGLQNGLELVFNKESVKPQAFTLCNLIFKISTIKRLDAFSNENNLLCDSELFLSICLTGTVCYVDSISSLYRRHSSNLVDTLNKNPNIQLGCLDYVAKPYSIILKSNHSKDIKLRFYRKLLLPTLLSIYQNLILTHNFSKLESLSEINEVLEKFKIPKFEPTLKDNIKLHLKMLFK